MIYTVTYFNPLGNCDNITYVEADNEVDAALIAHADFWVASKPFDLSDYHVLEYEPDCVVRKSDILEKGLKREGGWTEELLDKKKNEALQEYVLDDWRLAYKKYGEKGLDELKANIVDKFGAKMGSNNTATLVTDILSKAGELNDGIKILKEKNNEKPFGTK